MSRKDFISDQLVDIRSQLRDSYNSYHAARKADKEEESPVDLTEENVLTNEIKKDSVEQTVASRPAEKYLPSMRATDDRSTEARERRELEGRIIHDMAAIDCEREKLKCKLEELEKFAEVLDSSRKQVADGDFCSAGRAYFAARGRWSSFEDRYEASVVGENIPASGERKGFWIIAISVLLGSLIVAFALIQAFSI
jgi:hypothetical protein